MQPQPPRRWILCADDYAIDAGATEGIADLLARGRLTSTSVLVDSPHWPAVATSLPSGSLADVGLHLNLTQTFPGCRHRTWSLRELILRSVVGAVPRDLVREAIDMQFDAFEAGLGRRPDYVDGHQHVHQFAGVREELLAALRRRYPNDPLWLRSTRPPPGIRDRKARFIASLGDAALRRLSSATSLRMSTALVGVYDFAPDADLYWHNLARWIAAGPDGSVLMCHPSRTAEAGDSIAAARVMEHAILASDRFAQMLQDAKILGIRGKDCLGTTT